MDILINCLFMNTAKPSQDFSMQEQQGMDQVIPQDFLAILLDRLSEGSNAFLVNPEGREDKQQGLETMQGDEPSGDMDNKKDLMSLLQPWLLWEQEPAGKPPVHIDGINDANEKEEDATAHPEMAETLNALYSDAKAGGEPLICFSVQRDDCADNGKADGQPAISHETTEEPATMFQTALTDKGLFVPVRDNMTAKERQDSVHVDNGPVKYIIHEKEGDLSLKPSEPVVGEERSLLSGEDRDEKELNGNYRILFQKRDAGTMDRKDIYGKGIVRDEAILPPREVIEEDQNITLLTVKRTSAPISPEGTTEKVKAVPGDEQESAMAKKETNLFQRGEDPRADRLYGKEGTKAFDRAFGSAIADRVAQVVEQYANKGTSMDMVMRLKIDEKETVLVGLKDDGQKVTVQIKTGSEGVMNFIQSQKDTIMRHLEGKNIYANIMVDINDQREFERRDRHEQEEKNGQYEEGEDFSAFLSELT